MYLLLLCQTHGIDSIDIPWPTTGATHYNAQIGLPYKGHASKGLVVCKYGWDLYNGLAIYFFQQFPED